MRISLLFFLLLGITASSIAADPTPHDRYEVLHGVGYNGSGFVVRYQGELYGVAPSRPLEGKDPTKLTTKEGDTISLDPAKAIKQKNVQALAVTTLSATLPFLAYDPEFTLHAGDEVIILSRTGGLVPGTLTAKSMRAGTYQASNGSRKLMVRTSLPVEMPIGQGGPVFLKRSGAVIGALVIPDDLDEAGTVGFETLCLASPFSNDFEFRDILGSWKRDWDLAKELYRDEEGESFSEEAWQKRKNSELKDTGGIDVEITVQSITFQRDGKKVVSYPVLETKKIGDNIVVTARYFMGGRTTFYFELLKDGHLLQKQHSDPEQWAPINVWKRE